MQPWGRKELQNLEVMMLSGFLGFKHMSHPEPRVCGGLSFSYSKTYQTSSWIFSGYNVLVLMLKLIVVFELIKFKVLVHYFFHIPVNRDSNGKFPVKFVAVLLLPHSLHYYFPEQSKEVFLYPRKPRNIFNVP